jgi:hypothetical protein
MASTSVFLILRIAKVYVVDVNQLGDREFI